MKFNLNNPITYIVGTFILCSLFYVFIREDNKVIVKYKNKEIEKLKGEDKILAQKEIEAVKTLDSLNKKILEFKFLVKSAKLQKDTVQIIVTQDSLINILDERINVSDTLNNFFKQGYVIKDSIINIQGRDLDSLSNELNGEKMKLQELREKIKRKRAIIIAAVATEISVIAIYLLFK